MFKAIKRIVGVVGVALLAFRAIGSFLSWVVSNAPKPRVATRKKEKVKGKQRECAHR